MKILTLQVLTGAILLIGGTASSQSAPATSSAPTCIDNLDAIARKLYLNYSGFRLELKGAKKTRYDAMMSALRVRARKTSSDDCFPVLHDYIAWFNDPHLFVYQSGTSDSSTTNLVRSRIRHIDMTEQQARALISSRGTRRDAIEGIWYDPMMRLAIVPDPSGAVGSFVGILLKPDTTTWSPGSVRATFRRRADGSYDATMYDQNYSVAHRDGKIYKRTIFRLDPVVWGRAYPLGPADSGLVDKVDPRRPTLTRRNNTVVISMTSHDPAYRAGFDSLIAAHHDDLVNANHIIVDLRGNQGGSAGTSNALLPYIVTREKRQTKYTTDFGEAVMLSSPDQISYAHWGFGSDTTAFAKSLIRRMGEHIGELVPLRDPQSPAEAVPEDSIIEGNWKVGVLVDRGTVSAAEVLVLQALKSTRAVVFGEPTEGALDYQSTRIIWFSPKERRWGLGYPTITSHATLPIGGMRGKGIEPDVRLDLSRLRDPIGTVDSMLSIKRR